MRRLALLLLLLPALAPAQIRVWEKSLAPGVSYRMEMDLNRPVTWHGIRWTPAARTAVARPELAGGETFHRLEGDGRETVGDMVLRTGAIAGVNADFFPFTGDPLGGMIINGELVSMPGRNRAIFAWGVEGIQFGRLQGSLEMAVGGQTTKLTDLNAEVGENQTILSTPAGGRAWSKANATHVLLEWTGRLTANGTVTAKVLRSLGESTSVTVNEGQAVLSGRGTGAAPLAGLKEGDQVVIRAAITGMDLAKVDQAIGGGPNLVTGGKADITLEQEGFREDFSTTRHPRTAIGRTANGEVWMVVVDGRQPGMSRGMSLLELAQLMVSLGCVDAVNMDGGGSSDIVIFGVSVNKPSDGQPRPVANGVLLFGPQKFVLQSDLPDAPPSFVIQGRARLTMGLFTNYRVLDQRGNEVPNAEVMWSASGDAWVDQGGVLRGVKPGTATLRAAVRGRIVEIKVTVEAAPTAPPPSGS